MTKYPKKKQKNNAVNIFIREKNIRHMCLLNSDKYKRRNRSEIERKDFSTREFNNG